MIFYVFLECVIFEYVCGLMEWVGVNVIEYMKCFLEFVGEIIEQVWCVLNSGFVGVKDCEIMECYFFQLFQIEFQIVGINYGDEEGNFVYVMKSKGFGLFWIKFIMIKNGI